MFEIPTGFTVWKEKDMMEAKKLLKRLNNWGGFAGLTPKFFLQRAVKN